jgi:hypothetical protein
MRAELNIGNPIGFVPVPPPPPPPAPNPIALRPLNPVTLNFQTPTDFMPLGNWGSRANWSIPIRGGAEGDHMLYLVQL